VVIWNENLAKIAEQYLRQGSKVYIEGALETRKWTDKSGAERYQTSVTLQGFNCSLVMLGDGERATGSHAPLHQPKPKATLGSSFADELDDSIPF
jgi:single-strand DNA-binding protein